MPDNFEVDDSYVRVRTVRDRYKFGPSFPEPTSMEEARNRITEWELKWNAINTPMRDEYAELDGSPISNLAWANIWRNHSKRKQRLKRQRILLTAWIRSHKPAKPQPMPDYDRQNTLALLKTCFKRLEKLREEYKDTNSEGYFNNAFGQVRLAYIEYRKLTKQTIPLDGSKRDMDAIAEMLTGHFQKGEG